MNEASSFGSTSVKRYFAPIVTSPQELPPSPRRGSSFKYAGVLKAFFDRASVGSNITREVPWATPGSTPPTRAPLTARPLSGKNPLLVPLRRMLRKVDDDDSDDLRSDPLKTVGVPIAVRCRSVKLPKSSVRPPSRPIVKLNGVCPTLTLPAD